MSGPTNQMPPMPGMAFSATGFVCCEGTGGAFRLQDPPGATIANLFAPNEMIAANLRGWINAGTRVTVAGMVIRSAGFAGKPDVQVTGVPTPAVAEAIPAMMAVPTEEAIVAVNPPILVPGMRIRLRGNLFVAALEMMQLILIPDDGTNRRIRLTFACNEVRSMLRRIGVTGEGQLAMPLPVAVDGIVRSGDSLCVDTIRRFAMMGAVPAFGQPLRCRERCPVNPTPGQLRQEMMRELQEAMMGLIRAGMGARRRPRR